MPNTYKSMTIRFGDFNIQTAYVLPKTTAEEKLELLQIVGSHNNGKAIIVGDINPRNFHWNTGINPKERRVRKWATMNAAT